jgi:hypothetical protein
MKRILLLSALVAIACGAAPAAPPATNSASTNRVLMIDPSATAVAAGRATLTIGALQRTGDIYGGSYQMKVSPYFFKSEKGRLAIVVPEAALAKIRQGKVATVIGTATTSGADGEARHIDAIATPINNERGTLKLWFMSGDRKMIFEPAYHFAVPADPAAPNKKNSLIRTVPISHREALEAAAKRR